MSLLYPEWYQCKSFKMKREWRFKPLQITNVFPVLQWNLPYVTTVIRGQQFVTSYLSQKISILKHFYLSYETTPAHKKSSSSHSTCSTVYTPTTIKWMQVVISTPYCDIHQCFSKNLWDLLILHHNWVTCNSVCKKNCEIWRASKKDFSTTKY